MFGSTPLLANEKGIINTNSIPEQMEPNTVITFIDDTHYKIEQGGTVAQTEYVDPIANQLIKYAKENGTYIGAYQGEIPKPVKGLSVFYADDGYLLKLSYPKNIKEPLLQPIVKHENIFQLDLKDTRMEDSPSVKSGPGPGAKLLCKWGKHENQIWMTKQKSIYGYGRATTFSDKIGERDNVLKKGDCATSIKYDNCSHGTKINVTMPLKGGPNSPNYHFLRKMDCGTLPDAVIDIWKTGVEYWGYKWSPTLSINQVQYIHEYSY